MYIYVGNHRAIVMKKLPCISAGSADLFFSFSFLYFSHTTLEHEVACLDITPTCKDFFEVYVDSLNLLVYGFLTRATGFWKLNYQH